jgi:hypothetical protein
MALTSQTPSFSKGATYSSMYFPSDLTKGNRPIMQMSCNKARNNLNDKFFIFLPMPQSLAFSDAATYNDAELNMAGVAAGALGAASSGGMAGAKDYVSRAVGGAVPNSLGELGQLTAQMAPLPDEVKSAVSIGLGTTLNKNITTEFTGMSTRRFQFQMKFMTKSQEESQTIRNICRAFRIGLYAEGNSLQLQYPPTWTIKFLHGSTLNDLEYIPKIYECYLDTMSTTYNSSSNLWFEDGAPLECDLALTFIETRALTAADIKDLDDTAFSEIRNKNVEVQTSPSRAGVITSTNTSSNQLP